MSRQLPERTFAFPLAFCLPAQSDKRVNSRQATALACPPHTCIGSVPGSTGIVLNRPAMILGRWRGPRHGPPCAVECPPRRSSNRTRDPRKDRLYPIERATDTKPPDSIWVLQTFILSFAGAKLSLLVQTYSVKLTTGESRLDSPRRPGSSSCRGAPAAQLRGVVIVQVPTLL